MKMPRTIIAAALVAASIAVPSSAQDTPAAKPEAPKAENESPKAERRTTFDARCDPAAALRVQLVITRLRDGKKEASLPYTFVVSGRRSGSCPASRARMRMGVDTPVPVMSVDAADPSKPKSTSIQYRNVGTNIDCSADDLGDGRFKLYLVVENSSSLPGSQNRSSDDLSSFPLFRRVEMSMEPILRDGQSAQTVASTDPVTGEVVKIDVTMTVVK
jgi:hypothetical protein